jgi:ABC-2 type transport system ATP-binding protein
MGTQKPIIHTQSLTKYYGKKRGIVDIDLKAYEGEVFGYLGPNGAGKTTTIRLLLNFIMPTKGAASVLARDIVAESTEVRRNVGYLPGDLSLYRKLTGNEFLRYFASIRGGIDWQYLEHLSERLHAELSARIGALSHGNKQKVGLIQAFMHRPRLLILDEPTTGFDPLIQQEFYRMVAEARQNGQTVFLSSHVMPEVERVCDRVGIIRDGALVAVETVDALKSRAVRRVEVHFAQPVPPERFSRIDGAREIQVHDSVMRCFMVGEMDALVKAAAEFHVVNMQIHEPSLEEVFLSYYGGEKGNA